MKSLCVEIHKLTRNTFKDIQKVLGKGVSGKVMDEVAQIIQNQTRFIVTSELIPSNEES